MYRTIAGGAFLFLWIVLLTNVPADATPSFEIIDFHSSTTDRFSPFHFVPLTEVGIKEVVPANFLPKYRKWKAELLATEYGRSLWDKYSNNSRFLLTIKVAASRKGGAGTDDFQWDADGNLVAATVTLGKDLDKGFPDPVYYPVMNSLASQIEIHSMTGDLLASTKMAHEIGHVSFTQQANEEVFRKQNRLMDNYYSIFLNNGFNTRDPRLVSLENELGARPLDIWEDREYWSEVSALQCLVQKIDRETYYCAVLNKIRSNVTSYASRYLNRFDLSTTANRPVCGH